MQLHAADTFQVGRYHVNGDSLLVQGSLAALHKRIRADAEPLAAITTPVIVRDSIGLPHHSRRREGKISRFTPSLLLYLENIELSLNY